MSATGDDLWRSLEERAGAQDVRAWIENEFPSLAAGLEGAVDRRQAMRLMGAALAMGGLAACREEEAIVPWVRQPENTVPGVPRHYATALLSEGHGIGAVVECHEGRPVKVEGNPDHPSSLGATDAVMQAACLELFDPARLSAPMRAGRPVGWGEVAQAALDMRQAMAESGGAGHAILIGAETSPTLKRQLQYLSERFPRLRIFRHAPAEGHAWREATGGLSDGPMAPLPDIGAADVVVSLDDDFLAHGPGRLAHARAFADARRVRRPGDTMLRLHALESTPTLTGAAADHRLSARPTAVSALARGLLAALDGATPDGLPEVQRDWLTRAAADLRGAQGRALVLAGDHQDPLVAHAALAANARLSGPMRLIPRPGAMPVEGDLAALCDAIRGGEVTHLLNLAFDPVGTAPGVVQADAALARLDTLWTLAQHRDATSELAHWLLPAAHPFEQWSDTRAHDGTASVIQPLIRPLHAGRSAHQVLAMLAGQDATAAPGQGPVRQTWRELSDADWRAALQRGTIEGTAFAPVRLPDAPGPPPAARTTPQPGTDLRLVPDPWLGDGRHAESAMLQELPRPLSKLVWGNALELSPDHAKRLGVENGDLVSISHEGRAVRAPVWIMPGHPDMAATLTLGHGRGGDVSAIARGTDAYPLLPAEGTILTGVAIEGTGRRAMPITTQHHHGMDDRAPIRHATLTHFRETPQVAHAHHPPPPTESLYPDWPERGEQWAMTIDLTACTGCMACVSACAAENNTPSVGPEECELGREMHWLRVDRYYAGPPEAPETMFQPVPCMHCEKAPCEPVCPVNATVHTTSGLNAQVYNRCIGTRYCSQNCPYKVRRFNFLDYNDFRMPDETAAAKNPDVSIRQRGVMEKCTYCVQRISAARIQSEIDGTETIEDGAILTACQQACPAQAITFGDKADPDTAVSREKENPLNYGLLEHLNTRPRTTYLARLRNKAGEDTDG